MGEAKRRKAILSDRYGKPKTLVEVDWYSMSQPQQEALALILYPFPRKSMALGGWTAMACEAAAIEWRQHHEYVVNNWQAALLLLLKGVLSASGSLDGDVTDEGTQQIKEAGHQLFEIGGTPEMLNTATTWVARPWQRVVDVLWDGIGEWQS